MSGPWLPELHRRFGAHFGRLNGLECVDHYGDPKSEYEKLRHHAGIIDLTYRSRLCLTGPDRVRFLHGQVTNNVKDLQPGQGCYAALVTAKGRMVSDLNLYCLTGELLLDFEPGLTPNVSTRLEKFIIADDVQIVDAAEGYGLLSVQGPEAAAVIHEALDIGSPAPLMNWMAKADASGSEVYCMNLPRGSAIGYDVYVPAVAMESTMERLIAAAQRIGGGPCGWEALETRRIESGIPRFGVDMDETTLPPEAGIEARAISYAKGCYIGQEVIARVRTYGQVARALRGLRLADDLPTLPLRGDKLFSRDKEVGSITSAVHSTFLQANIALGYVRRECNQLGTELVLRTKSGESTARVVETPFAP